MLGIKLKNYATTQGLVMLKVTKDRPANGYSWVKWEDTKYQKVNNNLDDQVSICLACVNFCICFKN